MSRVRRTSCSGAGSKSRESPQLDCTADCSFAQHASLVLSCVATGNLRLVQHCSSVCGNACNISDAFGRNALHVAASRGLLAVLEWLLLRRRVAVDGVDHESRWSALHRAVYSGQLGAAVFLAKNGASLSLKDFDGATPLSLLNLDRCYLTSAPVVSTVSLYTWGRNANMTLGHDHSRSHPERLELLSRHTVVQVLLCKFHCVFLTEEGRVLTCGHGRGGRLGHGSETSVVAPCVIAALLNEKITAIAAARDHTVVLSESGAVFTFGLNDVHQLGQPNAQGPVTTPRPVRALKSKRVVAVGVGRYHTAVSTATEVYTFGQNLGQLGHDRSADIQPLPRAVPSVGVDRSDDDDVITHLSVSDAATACLTRHHRLFVCSGYTVKSIRCSFLEKLACTQFTVCASLSDLDHLRQKMTEPTKCMILDSQHKLWCWEPMKKGGQPHLLPGMAKFKVKQFSLGKSLTVVTAEGEVFTGASEAGRPLQLSRVAMAQAARAVFTDFKANNFAYLQNEYRTPFVPTVSAGSLRFDLSSLLEEACLPGSVSDFEIEAGGQVFFVHKFLLCSASPVLSSLLQPHSGKKSGSNGRRPSLPPDCVLSLSSDRLTLPFSPQVVEAFLRYLYGGHVRINPPPPGALDDVHASLTPPHTPTSPLPPSASANSTLTLESTPDTSFASLDENDLSSEYDRFAGDVVSRDSWASDTPKFPPAIGQSTPKKHSRGPGARGNRSRWQQAGGLCYSHVEVGAGQAVWDLPSSGLGSDLQALLQLATAFQIPALKSSLESLLFHSPGGFQQPASLLSPKPSLSRVAGARLSDLLLAPSHGSPLPCHRCVLVARSEYFCSMLLMGWRESSGSVKSLSLPVSDKVLATLLDYMYTDEAPSIQGSVCVEWISSVLVMADQLLMSRLKLMCERALVATLTLRNVSKTLDFAVAYSADQLKKACLHFIGTNASSLLEGRYLEGLETPLLADLSTAYQEMVPTVCKRALKFSEPSPSDIPESYFRDEGQDNTLLSGSGSDMELQDSTLTHTHSSTSHDDRESQFRSPTPHDSFSPSTHSSSRRKRKRKSSHSDSKKPQQRSGSPYTPPTSPVNPNEDTPTPRDRPPFCSSPEIKEASMSSAPPKSTDSKRSPTHRLQPVNGAAVASITSTAASPREASTTSATTASTPWSDPGRRTTTNFQVAGAAKPQRLANRFDAACETSQAPVSSSPNALPSNGFHSSVQSALRAGEVPVVPSGNEGRPPAKQPSPPPHQRRGSGVAGGWQRPPCGSPSPPPPSPPPPPSSVPKTTTTTATAWCKVATSDRSNSLREIMAQEERTVKETAEKEQKATSPLQSAGSHSVRRAPHPHLHALSGSTPPRAILHQRQLSFEGSSPSSSGVGPQPSSSPSSATPPSNPWGTAGVLSTSPSVSMRELMAADEAEEGRRRRQREAEAAAISSRKADKERPTQRQPTVVPHHKVSFADIVHSQEQEQEKLKRDKTGKPLSFIQIEQRAISELRLLYKAQDNPDEYITVERYRPRERKVSASRASFSAPRWIQKKAPVGKAASTQILSS